MEITIEGKTYNRLVILGAYYYSYKRDVIEYCNLEIFQNGHRIYFSIIGFGPMWMANYRRRGVQITYALSTWKEDYRIFTITVGNWKEIQIFLIPQNEANKLENINYTTLYKLRDYDELDMYFSDNNELALKIQENNDIQAEEALDKEIFKAFLDYGRRNYRLLPPGAQI